MRLTAGSLLAAAATALVAATLAVYWGAWRFDFVNFDDDVSVLTNPRLAPGGGPPLHLFRLERGREYLPLRDASYLLDRSLYGGLRPGGFHATNLALHAASGLLVLGLGAALGLAAPAAAFAAALFLLHPLQVEPVAWVSGRKDLLAAFFLLLSWFAHARGRRAASFFLFLAAGLSKATVVGFPIVLALDARLRARRPWGAALRGAAPHAAAALLVAWLQLRTAGEAGMLSEGAGRGPLASLLLAAKLVWLYLGAVVWPAGLHVIYSPAVPDPALPASWAPLLGLLALAALAARAGRARPLAAVGAAAFLALLLPTLGLVPFQLLRADRYAYAPLAGLALAVAALLPAATPPPDAPGRRRFASWAPLLVLVPLALTARRETAAWRNSETLWTREIARDPTHAEAWANLGHHYLEEARAAQRASDEGPRYEDTGNERDAIERAKERSSAHVFARKAAKALARAAEIRPGSPEILVNLALAASMAGQHVEAAEAARFGIAAAPYDPLVLYNAACVFSRAGDRDGALAALARAARIGLPANVDAGSDPDLAPLRDDPRFADALAGRWTP